MSVDAHEERLAIVPHGRQPAVLQHIRRFVEGLQS